MHEFELGELFDNWLLANESLPVGVGQPLVPAVSQYLAQRSRRYKEKHGCSRPDINTDTWLVAPELCRLFPKNKFLVVRSVPRVMLTLPYIPTTTYMHLSSMLTNKARSVPRVACLLYLLYLQA